MVTESFPFGESEIGFLLTEFEAMCRHFEVTILSYSNQERLSYNIPQTVKAYHLRHSRPGMTELLSAIKNHEVQKDIRQMCRTTTSLKMKVLRAVDIVVYSAKADHLLKQMQDIIVRQKIDIVYTYWCTQATVAALRLKKVFPKLKVITRFHGFDLYQERQIHGWQPLRPFIAQNADALIFACRTGKQYFQNTWPGEWSRRSQIAYLGTERACWKKEQFHSNKLMIISCSNLIPLKRVELIVQALALLPDTVPVEWHHFGDGISRNDLEQLAKRLLEGKKNIIYSFRGAVPHDKIIECYSELDPDVFITTSSTEGLPISVQEAFAMGIPAIGTDVGGMGELIKNGVNGYLLPADTTAQCVSDTVMRYFQLTSEQKQAFGQAAVESWNTQFSAKKNAQQFADMLAVL